MITKSITDCLPILSNMMLFQTECFDDSLNGELVSFKVLCIHTYISSFIQSVYLSLVHIIQPTQFVTEWLLDHFLQYTSNSALIPGAAGVLGATGVRLLGCYVVIPG